MHTLEIPDIDLTINIPENWHEMSAAQRSWCLQQAIDFNNGHITYDDFLIRTFYKLANVKRNWFTYVWENLAGKELVSRKNTNIRILAEQIVCSIFNLSDGQLIDISYNCEINPLPLIKLRPQIWKKQVQLIGPQNLIENISFGEFRTAIEEMNQYFESKVEAQLNRFIACLYRPYRANIERVRQSENFDGQLREPFNLNRIEINARLIAKIPAWKKMAVLLWFAYCVKYLQEDDLIINGREINLSELFPKPAKGEESVKDPSAAGWHGILIGIAKEGPFGDAEKTDKQDLFIILEHMYDQHQEGKRIKAKYKSKK